MINSDDARPAADAVEAERIRNEVVVDRQFTGTSRIVRFVVGRNHGKGWRLDKYLHAILPTISRSMLRRWLELGSATIDGVVADARAKLHPGHRVELSAPLPAQEVGVSEALHILHQDDLFLAVDKPAGVLSHQAGRQLSGTLINQAQDWMSAHGRDPHSARLVNRIDRDTSGIVLISLDERAHVYLAAAMEARDLTKEYVAICRGVPDPRAGSWKDPIAEGGDETIAMRITPEGKPCHTDYAVVEDTSTYAWLRVRLHTGRQHQIRLHAAHHGHPLVGDWVYGEPCVELPGQALHAALLVFPHPATGEPVRVESPLPPRLAALWQQLAAGGAPTPCALSDDQRDKLGHVAPIAPRLPSWLTAEEYALLQRELDNQP